MRQCFGVSLSEERLFTGVARRRQGAAVYASMDSGLVFSESASQLGDPYQSFHETRLAQCAIKAQASLQMLLLIESECARMLA